MKLQLIILLLSFAVLESHSQTNKDNFEFTNVSHYGNNIQVKYSDKTNATIYINGSSARLVNSDGSQSTIDFFGNSSNLIAIDGTSSSISHNRYASTVLNSDGSLLIVNHMQSSSSCSTPMGKHSIAHTFGYEREMKCKDRIDVLIHRNWLLRKQAQEATAKLNDKEQLNEQ